MGWVGASNTKSEETINAKSENRVGFVGSVAMAPSKISADMHVTGSEEWDKASECGKTLDVAYRNRGGKYGAEGGSGIAAIPGAAYWPRYRTNGDTVTAIASQPKGNSRNGDKRDDRGGRAYAQSLETGTHNPQHRQHQERCHDEGKRAGQGYRRFVLPYESGKGRVRLGV